MVLFFFIFKVVNIKLNVTCSCGYFISGDMWLFIGEEVEVEIWKGELSCFLGI